MLDYSQLEALLAIDDQGTIEGAARALRVSSFAVSQRVSQLEKNVGVVLVERGPTRTSDAGKILCEHTRQVSQIEQELITAHLNGGSPDDDNNAPIFRVALSEQIIKGWFRNVLKSCIEEDNQTRIDVTTSNPNKSVDLMQSGDVVAGVSTAKNPINGFKVYRLCEARFVAVASPSFIDACFTDGVTQDALAKAPCLRHCHNDGLALAWVEQQFAKPPVLPLRKIPDIQGALNSVLSGNAWTMIEESEAAPYLDAGQLAELIPSTALTQPLYWHVAIAMIDTMAGLTKLVRQHAG